MKFRESGMPNEEMWDTFFSPEQVLVKLGLKQECDLLVNVGCGYGTFLVPAAKYIRGKVIGIDVDHEMIGICKQKVENADLKNVELWKRDIFSKGFGIENGTDAQFAGSSSVPAHVDMMGFIGMGNNPIVGATVALAVRVAEAL